MARPEKVAAVEELKEKIQNNAICILTRYQGINVAEATDLRAKLRAQDVVFKVYKNTLATRALSELGFDDATSLMEGPTAWAFSQDPVSPAKILKEFGKDVEFVAMQGGILDGAIISAERLNALADLPPRDQLIAQTVGTIAMPLRNLVGTLAAVPRNLVNVLDQVRKQKEEAQPA